MAIEVPWGDLDHAFGEVYKDLKRQVKIPGFRPGKVPNRVLDQRLGRPVVLEQVVQHAIPEVYSEVVRENQVRVLGQPEIEVTRLEDNDTLAFTAEVGSGQLMQGLDDAVRGLSAGESRTFETALLSGPNAGENAEVTVTVRSVKTKELPELDDDFASTASEFDTLAELRDDVRERLQRVKTMQQGADARDKLVEHLLETVEVPIPENLVDREVDWRAQQLERELAQAGMNWDDYFSAAGVENRETYDTDLRKNVTEAVKTQFILDAVADAREITVDNDDLSAQIVAQAQRSRMSPEQYAQQLQQSGNIAEFVADVRRTKALAQLLEQTTITDESGNTVDLEALRPKTVQAAAPAADEEEPPGPVEITDEEAEQ